MTAIKSSRTPTVLAAVSTLLLASVASAHVPKRLALELEPRAHGKGKLAVAESTSRRLATHLVPLLEGLGYSVQRVDSAKKAVRKEDYHLGIKLAVDAKEIYLVHEALQYRKHVEAQYDTGVSTWSEFKLFGYRGRNAQFAEGKVGPIDSRVAESPWGARALMDDQDSVTRVMASELADVIGELFRDYEEPALPDDDE